LDGTIAPRGFQFFTVVSGGKCKCKRSIVMPMFPGMGIIFAVLLTIAPLWIVSELKEVRKVNERILKKLQEK
jgi:hypothetical protein